MEKYDEKYYTSLNYTDYLSRQDKYIKTAEEINDLMTKIGIVDKYNKRNVLDYGAGVGFLVKAFYNMNYYAYGAEISDWAMNQAVKRGVYLWDLKDTNLMYRLYHELYKDLEFSFVTCLDVFEHMEDDDIINTFLTFNSHYWIVRIPCSTDGGQSFHLDVSNRDKTHINCKTKDQWKKMLTDYGFKSFLHLNLLTIYDTPGVFCALCIK